MKVFLRKKSAHFKRLVLLLPKAFVGAVQNVNVRDEFQEAAGEEGGGGGATWHNPNKEGFIGGAPQGMQGASNTVNQMLKGMRAASAEFRQGQGVSGMGYQMK